uniref:hypothetical protein n=1 Tax=Alistipes sp. TaxID=1872444 RepID=UPI0040562542
MRKLLLFAALMMALPAFVGCSDGSTEENGEVIVPLKQSDLYGSWKQAEDRMTIYQDGSYAVVGSNYSHSGTWSFDGITRVWVQHREDGKSFTNVILVLDEKTLSYTDQYGNHYVWLRDKSTQGPEDAPQQGPTSGIHNGFEWVDLGLSVKWATINIGGDVESNFVSDYFAWGETYTKESYSKANCSTYGLDIADFSGDPQYDAARANWGGNWRMPTKEELMELLNECSWSWHSQTEDRWYGYFVTGPNGKSIFLPLNNRIEMGSLILSGYSGYYWSSTPGEDTNQAYHLVIYNPEKETFPNRVNDYERWIGYTIRAVLD